MLQIDGLRSFSAPGTHLGVVGFPITHSISPVFQNAALRAMDRLHPELRDWHYHKIEAPVEALKTVITLAVEKGFRGLNLTIPHKVEVLQYLDHIDPVAARMGAVNTLLFGADGIAGHNTDGYGIATAIRQELGVELHNRPVVMLGAGGASRAACVQCLEDGCPELWIGNRSVERLDVLLQRLRRDYPDRKIKGFRLTEEEPAISGEGAILINATAVGLKPEDPMPVAPTTIGKVSCVYDMVYGTHVTALLQEARRLALPASDGLSMLIHQGARSLQLWTGKPVPVEVMSAAVKAHMGK